MITRREFAKFVAVSGTALSATAKVAMALSRTPQNAGTEIKEITKSPEWANHINHG